MDYVEIGSVAYFTNVGGGLVPSDEDAEQVAAELADTLEARLKREPALDGIAILRVEYELGCIVTTITLGAAAAAVYKFVKDYPALKKGLKALFADLNGLRVKLTKLKKIETTWLYRDDLRSPSEIEAAKPLPVAGRKPTRRAGTAKATSRARR